MRKAKTLSGAVRLVALAAVLAAAGGCDSGGNSLGPGHSTTFKARGAKPAKPARGPANELAEMVSAVSTTKNGPPVQLKFSLTQRPEVGQVMELRIAVITLDPVPDGISASFQAVDGLDVVDGAQFPQLKPTEGEPLRHVVKILPKRDGIFTLSATVDLISADQTTSRTFSIPVICGQGMREQVAKSP